MQETSPVATEKLSYYCTPMVQMPKGKIALAVRGTALVLENMWLLGADVRGILVIESGLYNEL